jgi:hypothetical protein
VECQAGEGDVLLSPFSGNDMKILSLGYQLLALETRWTFAIKLKKVIGIMPLLSYSM